MEDGFFAQKADGMGDLRWSEYGVKCDWGALARTTDGGEGSPRENEKREEGLRGIERGERVVTASMHLRKNRGRRVVHDADWFAVGDTATVECGGKSRGWRGSSEERRMVNTTKRAMMYLPNGDGK